ncbi:MAG TPA: LPS export ABC transporter permease LptF [Candidatus Bilophila faecipullorum]|uniref:LPS export ABC transporter permease LptF n=1 Tax=Candidatus Bilophila faecipullorum TaxID=2838482 RepID=A0A9D1QZ43_9BACT|nr:LPS export ABC transporter permease LptF [uncultured Bilophila sp.]HIW78017.1 LPS export ABC transporter permease LptF [Candidatus Bilophila faecipullorum]
MPSLLQRQIFKEIVNLFLLGVGVLLTLILISRAVQMRDLFLGLDLGLLDTVLLFAYMTPLFLMLVIPIACMLSVFLTFLRMSTDRELVALRAGGINIYQMLPAPLLFSVLCMLLTLWVSLHWLAWGMGHFRETVLDIANTRARIVVQPGVFNNDFPNLVLFARQVSPRDGEMAQVLVDDRSHPERHMTILAPMGRIDTDAERGELVFRLHDGKIYTTDNKGSSVLAFDGYTVRLPLDSLFKNLDLGEVRPREMSWSELSSITREEALQRDVNYANKLDVERQKRWAYPMACIALTLFVLPLAAAFEGLHRQTGLVLALGMFFVYYSLMSLGFSTGEAGTIPPVIGLWAPNVLFLCLGIYGLHLTAQERTPHLLSFLRNLRARRVS